MAALQGLVSRCVRQAEQIATSAQLGREVGSTIADWAKATAEQAHALPGDQGPALLLRVVGSLKVLISTNPQEQSLKRDALQLCADRLSGTAALMKPEGEA